MEREEYHNQVFSSMMSLPLRKVDSSKVPLYCCLMKTIQTNHYVKCCALNKKRLLDEIRCSIEKWRRKMSKIEGKVKMYPKVRKMLCPSGDDRAK